MKKNILLVLFTAIFSVSLSAQEIAPAFIMIPDSLLFGVDLTAKERLIDRTESDTTQIKIQSILGGEVVRTGISDTYLNLQTSSVGNLQLKMLPLINNSQIIAVIRTVCAKACDSTVNFYTTDWQPLSGVTLFPALNIDSFIKPDVDRNDEKFRRALAAVDVFPLYITANADTDSFEVSTDIDTYLSKEDFGKLKPYLNTDPQVLNWNKVSFK